MLKRSLTYGRKHIFLFTSGWILLAIGFVSPVAGQARTMSNLALHQDAFMVRLTDSLPPASNANDGDLSTRIETSPRTVDAYWEVDLGQMYAIYSIHVVPANGFSDRMTHATARLFDTEHESVYSQRLGSYNASGFQVDLSGPRAARYVRIGLEHKERTSPTGGIEWYIGIKEVEVYGRDLAEIGLLSFTTSTQTSTSGQAVTLSWHIEDVSELTLYPDPGLGSLMAFTDSQGRGSITVSPESSTEYRLIAEGSFGLQTLAQSVIVDRQPLPVRINEFLAKNQLSLRDQYGDSSDWIELYNPSNTAVDLTGYGLSDDLRNTMKWTFPTARIEPHDHLIVFASGRNDPNTVIEEELHADWRLDADGEHLLLTAPDGVTTVDAVLDYEPQCADLTYGRSLTSNTWVFLEPTPLAINNAPSYRGWLTPPIVSHERGFYDGPFELTVQHHNPDATLVFSLNEQAPHTPLPNPFVFSLNGTKIINLAVEQSGYKSPPVVTHTYLFLDDVISSPLMRKSITQNSRYTRRLRKGLTDLPTFSITVPELPDDYIERPASLEILWPDGSAPVHVGCGMSRYGGAWTPFAKKNYKLKFRKEYGARKLRAPLFNGFEHSFPVVEEFDTLELRGGSHDMNQRGFYMAACFVEDSMLDMGSLNPHGRFVHLYINGDYWGQFYLREQLKDHFLGDYLPGRKEDYFNVKGNDNVGSNFVPGTPDPLHRHRWTDIRTMSSYQELKAYIDVPNLIDFMLLWAYGDCETEYRAAGPVAPGDTSLGFKFWIGDSDGFLRTSAMGRNKVGSPGPGNLFGILVAEADPEFMTLLSGRIEKHLTTEGTLGPQACTERLAQRMAEIQDSLIAECARWNYRTPENWLSAADNIYQNLFPGRAGQLLGYLRDRGLYTQLEKPIFNQPGGTVKAGFQLSMSATLGQIYYTLDGSDPKASDGTVALGARLYVSPDFTEILVPAGSMWGYWDQGSQPAANWASPAFDDTAWPRGPAQLGYGDDDERTRLSYGSNPSNKHLAYYFRHRFTVTDTIGLTGLAVDLIRDDGAVVYLNGSELFRSNMPSGPITASSLSASVIGGGEESTWYPFTAPVDHLVVGDNVLAVEIHQTSPTSSDISFDLKLGIKRSTEDQAIILRADTTVKARAWTGVQWSDLSEAFFKVQ